MKAKNSIGWAVVALFLFGYVAAHAQALSYQRLSTFQHNRNLRIIPYKPGVVTNVLVSQNGTPHVSQLDMTEQVNLIVEFKGEPMFLQQMRNPSHPVQPSVYQSQQRQFLSNLVTLHQAAVKGLRVALSAPTVTREYYKTFNGAALTVPRAMVSQIASLSYVKRVFIDRPVKALLERSVHQIRADSVWARLKTRGKGVLVGIIDTGIDYDDSALGGGIGPSYKVVGGYNFINNTTNAMDDNGHGTHVAGIIAADGDGLMGVAPLAKLYAFKALNQYGEGSESDIIAAIQRCADPNNTGSDSDKVDIVNMSLGGSGGPEDAMSTAVDSAAELGITFCVAAGNSGVMGYYTIGSPGTARLAITVGAVDSTDQLAYFSSKGPDQGNCIIKPDVLAPGVNVTSTYLNNTEATLSGTSMATPFVAGVCALLKSLHKDWSPATIRSAVMTTAVNIGQKVMAQGAGRIDALNAAEASAFAYPSDLSFGFDSSAASVWTELDTLWVANSDSVSQSFSLSFDSVPTGVTISAAPSSFSISSNDSQMVIITLTVDNSVVPFPQQGSLAYSGFAYLDGTRDTLHLPWAFVKAARVLFTFDKPEPDFQLWNSKSEYLSGSASWYNEYEAELVIPKGEYDMITDFYSPTSERLVAKQNMAFAGASSVSIASSEAKNLVLLDGVDAGGQPLSSYPSLVNEYTLAYNDSTESFSTSTIGSTDSLYFSGLSDRFTLGCVQDANDGLNRIFNVQFDSLPGVNASVTLTNNPADFYTQNIHALFPSFSGIVKQIDCVDWSMITIPHVATFGFGLGTKITSGFKGDWSGTLYLTRNATELNNFPTSVESYIGPQSGLNSSPWYLAPAAQVVNDSVGDFFGDTPASTSYTGSNGGHVTFGITPLYPLVQAYNDVAGKSNIYDFTLFFGSLGEQYYMPVDSAVYTIYNAQNEVVASGNQASFPGDGISVPAGPYRYRVVNNDYFIRGLRGSATLTCGFDLTKSDPDPPIFTSMSLTDSTGFRVDSIGQGERATLRFSAMGAYISVNDSGLASVHQVPLVSDSTRLFYKMHDSTDWLPLPVTLMRTDTILGYQYSANVAQTSAMDSSAVDIRVDIRDQAGNTAEWVMDPAYSIGDYGIATGVEQNPAANNIPKVFALHQNYPNPFNPSTTIKYDLPRSAHVSLVVYDILGQEVARIVDATQQAGDYTVKWDGNTRGGLAASGIYFLRLRAGDYVKTIKMLLLK